MPSETVIRRIFAYKINTPILNIEQNKMNDKIYLNEIFESFLNEINAQDAQYKPLRDGGKFFTLHNYHDSEDADFIEGTFHTTRYGSQNDIIAIENEAIEGQVLPNQGVKYDIHFVLSKKDGLLLVESDPYRVATRNTIETYLARKQLLLKDFINKYNALHKPFTIIDSFVFSIESVMDSGFESQLKKIVRIKEVSGYVEVKEDAQNAAVAKFRKPEKSEDNDISDVTEMRVSLINSVRNSGLKQVKRFIKNSLDLQKFARFEVSGYDNINKKITATFNIKPVSFYVSVDQNSNGIIDGSQLLNQMVDIAKNENPLGE
ncbi:hypothetical protein [Sporolactobacillus terrae]|uniref:hypothetical protein n=1 Tax=Sporolactobacillus terrae TaxID=269673 RepID=UPI0004904E6F|nr:hypothetical protein [Sporolactobacillus terrae]